MRLRDAEEAERERLAAAEADVVRVRENLESVSRAFKSEVDKVTALEAQVLELESRVRQAQRRNVFAGAGALAGAAAMAEQRAELSSPRRAPDGAGEGDDDGSGAGAGAGAAAAAAPPMPPASASGAAAAAGASPKAAGRSLFGLSFT